MREHPRMPACQTAMQPDHSRTLAEIDRKSWGTGQGSARPMGCQA